MLQINIFSRNSKTFLVFMVDVVLKHNPFSKKTECFCQGNLIDFSNVWGTQDKPLGEWVEFFFEKLDARCNDSTYNVKFIGLERDFDFLCDAKDAFVAQHHDVRIDIIFEEKILIDDKFERLKDVLTNMQENAPFEEFKKVNFRNIFEKAVSSEVELAVVASMSSGKSTLLNALLGTELLPARNEATTSVVMYIHDNKEKSSFSATLFEGENIVEKIDRVAIDDLNRLNALEPSNDKDGFSFSIHLYGDIKGIEPSGLNLVLIDTPGANNSENLNHQRLTYSLIDNDYKPIILFVLNATQLGTNDDDALLRKIARSMRLRNRQNSDRFFFVLNKVDALDPEKDGSLQEIIERAKAYLEKRGIDNPKIFPCEARSAKVFRQFLNGQSLSDYEKDDVLPRYKKINKREYCHYSDLAPLSKICKSQLNTKLDAVRHENGTDVEIREALLHSGVPAIELAINEYLSKYAKPEKLSAAVDALKCEWNKCYKGFDLQNHIASCENGLKSIDEELKKIDDDILALKSDIQDNQYACESELRERILEIYRQKKDEYDLDWIGYSSQEKGIAGTHPITDVEEIKICTKLKALRIDFKTKLESSVNIIVNDYIKSKGALMKDFRHKSAPESNFNLENVSVSAKPSTNRSKISGWAALVKEISPLTKLSSNDEHVVDYIEYLDDCVKFDNDIFFEKVFEVLIGFANQEQNQIQVFFKSSGDNFSQLLNEKNQIRENLEKERKNISMELEKHRSILVWISPIENELNKILEI